MANPHRGEVGVEVDGKRYTLKPTFNAFAEVEPLMGGQTAEQIIDSMLENGNFTGMRAVLWCLLQEYHRDEIVTLRDAGNWLDRAGGAIVGLDVIRRAIFANQEGDGKQDPPTAQDGTGERSTSAPAVPA